MYRSFTVDSRGCLSANLSVISPWRELAGQESLVGFRFQLVPAICVRCLAMKDFWNCPELPQVWNYLGVGLRVEMSPAPPVFPSRGSVGTSVGTSVVCAPLMIQNMNRRFLSTYLRLACPHWLIITQYILKNWRKLGGQSGTLSPQAGEQEPLQLHLQYSSDKTCYLQSHSSSFPCGRSLCVRWIHILWATTLQWLHINSIPDSVIESSPLAQTCGAVGIGNGFKPFLEERLCPPRVARGPACQRSICQRESLLAPPPSAGRPWISKMRKIQGKW